MGRYSRTFLTSVLMGLTADSAVSKVEPPTNNKLTAYYSAPMNVYA